MTQNFTDVFGSQTIPPAGQSYNTFNLTANSVSFWPYNYSGTGIVLAKINEVTCTAGVALTLPPASQVSTGEDVLIRNIGANTLTVLGATGITVATIPAATAQYLYVSNNATDAGVWGQVTFGAGSAQVNAAALAGFGLTAISATLNAATPTTATASNYVVTTNDRASLIEFSAGAATLTLPGTSTAGNNFLFYVKNAGTGAVTINPQGGDTIDTQINMILQPNESCMVVCSGAAWFTVGYGRSTLYQFNQLILDVSASGGLTVTLTTTQASNKLLTFVGNPTADVTIIVPNVVAIYYIQSNITTARSITIKTAAGTGVIVPQGQRTVAIDDGTNVSAAVSVTSTTTLSLIDGSATTPALFFSSQTNTGIYKFSTNGFGITVNGTSQVQVSATGTEITGTLKSDGLLTAAAGVNVTGTATITGNEAVSGTLNVTGVTTTAGITNVGALNNTGTATITGNEAVSGTLNVTGVTTTAGITNVGALNNTGSSVLNGAINLSGTGVVIANSIASPATFIAPGTAGNVLTSNGTNWVAQAISAGRYTVSARSTNTILGTADNSTAIVATSTFTQTFTAAATLGNGWFVFYRNDGTGAITLDPNAAETIDGFTTIVLQPAESCLIVCDGSNFHTYGLSGTLQRVAIATTSGSTIDFNNLPPNIKRATLSLRQVKTSPGSNALTVQIGSSSSGIITSGYVGSVAGSFSFSTAFAVMNAVSNSPAEGVVALNLLDTTSVAMQGSISIGGLNYLSAGSVPFSGTWNAVRLSTFPGSDPFSGGVASLLYEI